MRFYDKFMTMTMALTTLWGTARAAEPRAHVWLPTGGPTGIYAAKFGRFYPVDIIMKDIADQGITDAAVIITGNGVTQNPNQTEATCRVKPPSPFIPNPKMKEGRDYFDETLTEADKRGVRIWAGITVAYDRKGKSELFRGLDDPKCQETYAAFIEALADKYGKHPSFHGIVPHEWNHALALSTDRSDTARGRFSAFCEKNFGEPYRSEIMPPKTDPNDPWWRRYHLYKIQVMNDFTAAMAETARKRGLKTMFCYYISEAHYSSSWTWGYNPTDLERICDDFRSTADKELGKPYQNIKNCFMELGWTYRGRNLPSNFMYGIHGKEPSYFEFRAPNYPDATIAYYRKIRERKTGKPSDYDVYLAYFGRTRKVMELFYGQENTNKWMRLFKSLVGGESPAVVTVAGSSAPFVAQHPVSPGAAYQRQVNALMEGLTTAVDVDGFLLNSLFGEDPKNLARYQLIVIPEDVGAGMSEQQLDALRAYSRQGGKILAIASVPYGSRRDLTERKSMGPEWFGLESDTRRVGGYIKPVSEFGLPSDKIWVDRIATLQLDSARVEAKDSFTGKPLLTRHGDNWFWAPSYEESADSCLVKLVKTLTDVPVRLEKRAGQIKLRESVLKDQVLFLSFFHPGAASLIIRPERFEWKSDAVVMVKNILNGTVLFQGEASALPKGVPIAIDHEDAPYLLAIGRQDQVAKLPILFPGERFEGMTSFWETENPETLIDIPNRPGVKVGIYHGGKTTPELLKYLEEVEGLNPFILPRIDQDVLRQCEVMIIPEAGSSVFISASTNIIADWVRDGGRLMLIHGAITAGKGGTPLLPLCEKVTKVRCNRNDFPTELIISNTGNPLDIKGDAKGRFNPGFQFDYISFKPLDAKGQVIVADPTGNAVVLLQPVGAGKVVLNGLWTGYRGKDNLDSIGERCPPEGAEARLLSECVKWLGTEEKKETKR